ncbi:MAG: hypothetical protein L6Q29_03660 [Candidatus Pacebacteria bacterium]|nr:hypothetical protein [Candidatus Paceibacterota bacterium]NUQ57504.1 hypothetical protein [Candidatus Paceibacter sp.]
MALNLSAFGIKEKQTSNLNLSAFGIEPEKEIVKKETPSFRDILGSPGFKTAETTPMITEEKGIARLPFGKEPKEIPGGVVPALGVSLVGGLLEVIPRVGVQFLANIKGQKTEPLNLEFGDLGKRLGFDENKIKSSGEAFMDDFTKRQEKTPDDFSNKTFFKNFALSYGKNVLTPILDAFVAGSTGTTLAKTALKSTLKDPVTQFALKEMRITAEEAMDRDVLRYAFNRQWETIIGRGGSAQELNNLGKATEHLITKIEGGEPIFGLNKLGEYVQKTARRFLEDMSKTTNRLPVGLSIEDISKQLPAKIKEANKLVEQIKQAGGDIQKAQGILTDIGKATSVDAAENLLGQLKTLTQPSKEISPLLEEAKKYKSAEEFVKAQGKELYHGSPRSTFEQIQKEGLKIVDRKDTMNKGSGISFSLDKKHADKFGPRIGGGTVEALLDKSARLVEGDVFNSKVKEIYNGSTLYLREKARTQAADFFKKEGYDGIDFTKAKTKLASESAESEIRIWNLDKIKTKSQLTDIWNQANKGKNLPSKKSFLDTARKIKTEDLKILAEKFKSKELTQTRFEELVLEADFAKQAIEGNAAKELAKYSPKRGDFAGRLKEVTGKKEGGIFAQRGDDIVTELGFGSSEEAREAFELYTKQKKILDEIEKRITELRKTKAAIGKGEKLMKLAIGDRRARLRALKDRYNLTDAELAEIKGGRNLTAMSKSEFDNFIEQAEQMAQRLEGIREARISLLSTIHEKDLRKWENVRQAMKLPPINKMTAEQMNQLNEVLSQYKDADEFLTVRQLETIGQTELKGMRTTREVLEHLAKRYNLSVADLPNIKPHPWMYDAQLARQHPLYDLLVDKYNLSYLKAQSRIIELEKEMNELIKASRKFQLVPTDKNIIKWLEATAEERKVIKLSNAEMKAAQRMDAIFKEYYDWLVKRELDKKFSSRFEDKYFPHTRRGFLEAWKEDGFLKGVKEGFDQFKQEEKMLTILDEKTGDILPYQKWVGFTKFRTDKLTPTQNAAKAFKAYVTALEKARQFDEFIPEIMIYVHALTPKEMTPKGLQMNDALQRFVKTWINSKKGRVQKQIVTPGGKMDWALRMGATITRIKDLGLNIPVGIANIFGEQAGNLTMLRLKYPIGVARLATPKGQAIVKKYENYVGQTLWHKLTDASNTVGDTLLAGIFGLFGESSRKGNQVFLLGSMTPEEFAKGEISLERLAYLRKKQGKYRTVEGAESVFGKSAEAAVGGQYKKWAIPIIVSTKDNAVKLASILRSKGIKAALSSEEGAELFFSVILGSAVGLGIMGYYEEIKDKKDKNFLEDIIYKSGRDALSMIGALNPQFLASFAAPRLASFLVDLGEALDNIIRFEKYKTTGELKGIKQLKDILKPSIIRPFLREKKEDTIKIPSIKIPSIKL